MFFFIISLPCASHAAPAGAAEPFTPAAAWTLHDLTQLLRRRSAVVQELALQADLARADVRQSRLMDNPALDLSVGTLPLGTPNPPDLVDPLRHIPNYGVGLTLHPDLARRGPRLARAAALSQGAAADLAMEARGQALRLLHVLGAMASAALHLRADSSLAEEAHRALSVAQERVRTGYGAPLDGDRAQIEVFRFEQQVATDQSQIRAAQAECAAIVGAPCDPFPSDEAAAAFLGAWLGRAGPAEEPLSQRADLQALEARQQAAAAELRLATAQLIPDPTLRLGYLYDTFTVSGNQLHSMSVSLNLPLPLIDHGQAQAQAASAKLSRLGAVRALRIAAASARIATLRPALAQQRQRLQVLQQQVIPRARAILADVGRAFAARAVPLTDMITARRALDELLLQEASALEDAYQTVIALIEESPEESHE